MVLHIICFHEIILFMYHLLSTLPEVVLTTPTHPSLGNPSAWFPQPLGEDGTYSICGSLSPCSDLPQWAMELLNKAETL